MPFFLQNLIMLINGGITVRRGIHTHDDKDMDLYLRMTSSKQLVKFYDKVLVQSMVVLLDNENHRDHHQFGNIIQNTFPSPRICYMDPINIWGYSGRDRMQRVGAQWLSGRVLDSIPKGRGFEPHRRHCVVVLEQDTFILA